MIQSLKHLIAGAAATCLCAAGLSLLATSVPAQDGSGRPSFELTGILKQGIAMIRPFPVRVWDERETLRVTYSERDCQGTGTVVREEPGLIELDVTPDVPTSACQGGRLWARQTERDRWNAAWRIGNLPSPITDGILRFKQLSGTPRLLVPLPELEPRGEIITDARSGLSLASGPGRPGYGPTSLVVAVVPGSVADRAGVQTKDLILMVENGAANPAGHIGKMHRAFDRYDVAEIMVERPDGRERRIRIEPPMD